MSNMIHNEQTRLTASFFSNVGTGLVVSGVYVPAILHQEVIPGFGGHVLATFVVAMGMAFHLGARWQLTKIRE
jgi:hypothetical protein